MTKTLKRNRKTKKGKWMKHKTISKNKKTNHRVKKSYMGGAKWIKHRDDLSYIWNSLFYERAKENVNFPSDNNEDLNHKKCLFVIDMQNDFVDRPYKRAEDKHPILQHVEGVDPINANGNFDVADGYKMLEDNNGFLKYIKDAINDTKYEHIIFSRDYHPVGHMSFNKTFWCEPNLCGECENNNDGGNFPAHCVQGCNGTLFVNEIYTFLKDLDEDKSAKIKIVFKGIHKDYDSFSAVELGDIDNYASNIYSKDTKCGKKYESCSSVTGGYTLNKIDKESNKNYLTRCCDYNETIIFENNNPNGFTKETYDYITADTIEVCGLAGDYCVRDTIVALSKKYNDKKIVLMNDFTRYALLPFYSILFLPQHNYSNDLKQNFNSSIQKEYLNSDENEKEEMLKILTELVNNNKNKKDIIFYLIQTGNDNKHTLVEYTNESIISNEKLFAKNGDIFIGYEYKHFITPLSAIIEDYSKQNIYIKMKNFEKKKIL